MLKQPYMICIGDIKSMSHFENCEKVIPCLRDVMANINPKALNAHVVN